MFGFFRKMLAEKFLKKVIELNSASSKIYCVRRASNWEISPELQRNLNNVFNSGFLCLFQVRLSLCHGYIADICKKKLQLVDTSKALLTCCTNKKNKLDFMMLTELRAKQLRAFSCTLCCRSVVWRKSSRCIAIFFNWFALCDNFTAALITSKTASSVCVSLYLPASLQC